LALPFEDRPRAVFDQIQDLTKAAHSLNLETQQVMATTDLLQLQLYRTEDEDLRFLILAWYRRARHAQLGHVAAEARARRLERLLGVPAVVLSTIVGTAVFASVGKSPDQRLQILAGILSILAAGLIALQTFLRFDDKSREHKRSSQAFGALRRDLGQLGAVSGRPREEVKQELKRIHECYDHLSQNCPAVPAHLWYKEREHSRHYWPDEFLAWPENKDR
jgi:hypothetical protein